MSLLTWSPDPGELPEVGAYDLVSPNPFRTRLSAGHNVHHEAQSGRGDPGIYKAFSAMKTTLKIFFPIITYAFELFQF